MAKTRIGLDIGSTAVRIAEVQQGDRPSVLRLGQVPLPLGAVEAGEVQRPDQVGAALERLTEVSGIKGREVHMGMANAKVVAREISLPWLPEKELRSALGFQVQEFIPMPPEDAIMDFELLDQGRFAEAAWSGFLKARKYGTYKIYELIATGTMSRSGDPLTR